MTVQFTYTTLVTDISSRVNRSAWLKNRIPSEEYFIMTGLHELDSIDDVIETIITIWADDAERIATEFWFQFP